MLPFNHMNHILFGHGGPQADNQSENNDEKMEQHHHADKLDLSKSNELSNK